MNKAITLLAFYTCLGITWASVQQTLEMKNKINQLEIMIEQCLIKSTWNLQGYHFLCEATYMGTNDYQIYLKDIK